MNVNDFLSNAFKSLNEISLNEEAFEVDDSVIDNLNDTINPDDVNTDIEVIDPEADSKSDEELDNNAYIGSLLLQCAVCHSNIFKGVDDIEVDEDRGLVNTSDVCPYCGEMNGFTIIGQICEYVPEKSSDDEDENKSENDVEDNVTVEIDGETINDDAEPETDDDDDAEVEIESITSKYVNKHIQPVQEAIDTIRINTNDNTVSIETDSNNEDKVENDVELSVEPLPDDILDSADDDLSVEDTIINSVDDDSNDEEDIEEVDLTDLEEESFNRLSTRYLRNIYENVKYFRTTDAKIIGNKIQLEGVITFKSNNKKKTSFVFEAKDMTREGAVRFVGSNKSLTESANAFVLTGKLDKNDSCTKLVAESLSYNYVDIDNNNVRTPVKGSVRN